jgi:hypothetical protein
MSKYNSKIVDTICSYIRSGDSQKLACKKAGIGDSTFHEWIHKKKGFSDKIQKAKDEFQETITGKLEATLWKRAMGYEVTETDTEYVSDANGNPKIKSQKTKTKHIQPDTGALIFALTNVAPDKWVNKQKVETTETKSNDNKKEYCFENLPDNVLFDIADRLQDARQEKIKEEKETGANE